MSNRLHLIATKFVDVADGAESFGYRIFDDYEANYDNHWESTPTDDFDLLEAIYEEDDSDVVNLIDSHLNGGNRGMYINDCWYGADELLPRIDERGQADDV
jgi:hypothetical protein